ncbi:MAG TPA: ThiF family adenylyltransferase [Paenalcaligenes sp.]|nr:ThiF family adenylyltransferase [Paenalcaligenes sp.]
MSSHKDNARRFDGLNRLFGDQSVHKLQQAHVVVAGIGGVGSWCVETLARSGIGALTLVDMDIVSASNINRQLPALESTLGRSKIEVMAERIDEINRHCRVHLVDDFVTTENAAAFFAGTEQVIIDCTDDLNAKVALVLAAREHTDKKLLVCGAAGGKRNPMTLKEGDLSLATHDALLSRLRQRLRKQHGWPAGPRKSNQRPAKMHIHAFWFAEETVLPPAWAQDADPLQGLSCSGYGSAMSMTATMGLLVAQRAIDQVLVCP